RDRRSLAYALVLRSFRCGLELTAVPAVSEPAESDEDGLGNMISEPLVQAQAQGDPPDAGQRNIVAREIDPLEPVAFLEVHETVPLLVSVAEPRVDQVRDLTRGAGPDCVGDQRIRRSFVSVLDHGDDVQQARLCPGFVAEQLHEADQALAEKRPDEDASVEEGPRLSADRFDVLPIMWEGFPLAKRRLVVDR